MLTKAGGFGGDVAAVLYRVERAAGSALRCVEAAGAPAVEWALEARVSLGRLRWGAFSRIEFVGFYKRGERKGRHLL